MCFLPLKEMDSPFFFDEEVLRTPLTVCGGIVAAVAVMVMATRVGNGGISLVIVIEEKGKGAICFKGCRVMAPQASKRY